METDMLHSAWHALLIILDPVRMAYLFGGVCMGLSLGILPGIGGVAGTALLLPFTYNLDPPTAFAKRLIAFKLVINPPGVFVGDLVVALADRTCLVVSHGRKDSGTIMCFERNRRTS